MSNSIPSSSARRHTPALNSTKRITELKEVEEGISQLLHFAGCTIASLHPDPLSNFTSRITSFANNESDEENGGASIAKDVSGSAEEPEEKGEQFTKYAEAYYSTLNEIQLSLRSSIRHLRVSLASPAPLIDPTFGSVANIAGSIIASGGTGTSDKIKPLPLRSDITPASVKNSTDRSTSTLGVQALKLEEESWNDLVKVLGAKDMMME